MNLSRELTKAAHILGERLKAIQRVFDEYSKSQSAAEERQRQLEGVPKSVLAEITFDDASKREAQAEADRQYRTQNSIRRAAWLAFFAAVIYAGVAAFQLGGIRESNRISRESLESVQRAFINLHHIEAHRFMPPNQGHAWSFSIAVENGGTTPAPVAINRSEVKPLTNEPDEGTFIGERDKSGFSKFAIGPKSIPQFLSILTIPEDQILGSDLGDVKNLKNFKPMRLVEPVFVYGWIEYRDVFPRTKIHLTEFCTRLVAISFNPKTNILEWDSPTACVAHNCADEYCPDYRYLTDLKSKYLTE